MKLAIALLAAAAAVSIYATPASAAPSLLTSDAGYTGRGLDLSAAANGSYNFTFGPVAIDGLVFTVVSDSTNSGEGGVLGQGGYGLGANGSFGGDAVYAAVDGPTGYAQFLGDKGFAQFGLYFNYAAGYGDPATIASLDAAGNVIDSFNIDELAPISTPGGSNEFAFRGIGYDDGTEIYGIRFGGSYMLATGTADGLPSVSGGVPEPATWAMLIAGFGLVGAAARRSPATQDAARGRTAA
jgi:hypothetical protein